VVCDWTEIVAQLLDVLPSDEPGWPVPITHELSYRGAARAE
jgi:hypothetical protein